MGVAYDKYYKDKDYFGSPYKGLVKFFTDYPHKGHVLDLGCGQGRDAIMLARLGYIVHGVDVSSVGLNQMMEVKEKENLDITSECKDIYDVEINDKYDIVLLDSMFHFYKNDLEKEMELLKKVLVETKVGAVICICIQKGVKREKTLLTAINSIVESRELAKEYVHFELSNSEFLMVAIQKSGVKEI